MTTTKRTSIFELGDEKKHSVVYECRTEDAVARSVYISKSALPKKPFPALLTITIEHEEV